MYNQTVSCLDCDLCGPVMTLWTSGWLADTSQQLFFFFFFCCRIRIFTKFQIWFWYQSTLDQTSCSWFRGLDERSVAEVVGLVSHSASGHLHVLVPHTWEGYTDKTHIMDVCVCLCSTGLFVHRVIDEKKKEKVFSCLCVVEVQSKTPLWRSLLWSLSCVSPSAYSTGSSPIGLFIKTAGSGAAVDQAIDLVMAPNGYHIIS